MSGGIRRQRKGVLLASTVLVLAVAVLVVPAGSRAGSVTQTKQGFCSDGFTPPCLVSVKYDGVERHGDPDFLMDLYWGEYNNAADEGYLNFTGADHRPGAHTPGHFWEVTLRTGNVFPNQIVGLQGVGERDMSEVAGDDYLVHFTMESLTHTSGCEFDGPCPEVADTADIGGVFVHIADIGTTAADPGPVFGLATFSNIENQPALPEVDNNRDGTFDIDFPMSNSHFLSDGTTLFQGQFRMQIPRTFFTYIDDELENVPLTDVETDITGPGSGTVTAKLVDGGETLDVLGTGITFSQRSLRITAGSVIKPPSGLKVKAKGDGLELSFKKSKSKGVKKYLASCKAKGDTAKGGSKHSPIVLDHLKAGKTYKCTVRAKTKVGQSKPSGPDSAKVHG